MWNKIHILWKDKNFFFFLLCYTACGSLVSGPGIKPVPSALEARSLNHWTTKAVWEPQFNKLWRLPYASTLPPNLAPSDAHRSVALPFCPQFQEKVPDVKDRGEATPRRFRNPVVGCGLLPLPFLVGYSSHPGPGEMFIPFGVARFSK